MKTRNLMVILAVVIMAGLLALGGCKKKEAPASSTAEPNTTTEHSEHPH